MISSGKTDPPQCLVRVEENVDSPCLHFSNSAENAEEPFRASVLAEPCPGTVAQGVALVNT